MKIVGAVVVFFGHRVHDLTIPSIQIDDVPTGHGKPLALILAGMKSLSDGTTTDTKVLDDQLLNGSREEIWTIMQ